MTLALEPRERAFTLFAPEAAPRLAVPALVTQANALFRAELRAVQALTDPAGLLPERAALEFDLRPVGSAAAFTRVLVRTAPLDDAGVLRAEAERAVEAMGGAGFDALLARARRVWQVRRAPVLADDPSLARDERAPVALVAALAHALGAPVLPAWPGPMHGVRGARVWLLERGWPG